MWTAEVITRLLVIFLYAAAAGSAIRTLCTVKAKSRKFIAWMIVAIAVFWIGFYAYLLGDNWHNLDSHFPAVLSRVGHYMTAAMLLTISEITRDFDKRYERFML